MNYIEKCHNNNMILHSFFFDNLHKIESALRPGDSYYKLSNIVWPTTLEDIIKTQHKYPSEPFVKIILNTVVIDSHIINKPLVLPPDKISSLEYIPLHHNNLLILDSLLSNGSCSRYESKNKQVYSEHSGVMTVKNNKIDKIVISTQTNRLDPSDTTILLPNNTDEMLTSPYLFHTHPNATDYAGRLNEGIILEFPSVHDIFNFVKYVEVGQTQASIIVAPEGMYVIRSIIFDKKFKIDKDFSQKLKSFILDLEELAIQNSFTSKNLSDPDIFHQVVGSELTYIESYNEFIKETNIMIEYYPRIKKNGEWYLRPINLMFVA